MSHKNPIDPAADHPDEPGTQHLTRAQAAAAAKSPHDTDHHTADDPVPENLIPPDNITPISTGPSSSPATPQNLNPFPPETDHPDEPGTEHLTRAQVEAAEAEHNKNVAPPDLDIEELLPENLVIVPNDLSPSLPLPQHAMVRGDNWRGTPAITPELVSQLPAPLADCWNRIGVQGDQSCRELGTHGHCHNCPSYSRAAAQFLDRPLPADYRRDWTAHFAPEKHIATPAKTSVVIFRVATEWLALPTHTFQEIAERRPLHTLPHRQHTVVLGIVNIRGELLICAALQRLLGLEPAQSPTRVTSFERLLVADWGGQRIAFPVDEVHGVHRFHSADLREPPALHARSGVHCAAGIFPWRQHTVGLLDAETLAATLNRKLT